MIPMDPEQSGGPEWNYMASYHDNLVLRGQSVEAPTMSVGGLVVLGILLALVSSYYLKSKERK
jgi:hypothetical protein